MCDHGPFTYPEDEPRSACWTDSAAMQKFKDRLSQQEVNSLCHSTEQFGLQAADPYVADLLVELRCPEKYFRLSLGLPAHVALACQHWATQRGADPEAGVRVAVDSSAMIEMLRQALLAAPQRRPGDDGSAPAVSDWQWRALSYKARTLGMGGPGRRLIRFRMTKHSAKDPASKADTIDHGWMNVPDELLGDAALPELHRLMSGLVLQASGGAYTVASIKQGAVLVDEANNITRSTGAPPALIASTEDAQLQTLEDVSRRLHEHLSALPCTCSRGSGDHIQLMRDAAAPFSDQLAAAVKFTPLPQPSSAGGAPPATPARAGPEAAQELQGDAASVQWEEKLGAVKAGIFTFLDLGLHPVQPLPSGAHDASCSCDHCLAWDAMPHALNTCTCGSAQLYFCQAGVLPDPDSGCGRCSRVGIHVCELCATKNGLGCSRRCALQGDCVYKGGFRHVAEDSDHLHTLCANGSPHAPRVMHWECWLQFKRLNPILSRDLERTKSPIPCVGPAGDPCPGVWIKLEISKQRGKVKKTLLDVPPPSNTQQKSGQKPAGAAGDHAVAGGPSSNALRRPRLTPGGVIQPAMPAGVEKTGNSVGAVVDRSVSEQGRLDAAGAQALAQARDEIARQQQEKQRLLEEKKAREREAAEAGSASVVRKLDTKGSHPCVFGKCDKQLVNVVDKRVLIMCSEQGTLACHFKCWKKLEEAQRASPDKCVGGCSGDWNQVEVWEGPVQVKVLQAVSKAASKGAPPTMPPGAADASAPVEPATQALEPTSPSARPSPAATHDIVVRPPLDVTHEQRAKSQRMPSVDALSPEEAPANLVPEETEQVVGILLPKHERDAKERAAGQLHSGKNRAAKKTKPSKLTMQQVYAQTQAAASVRPQPAATTTLAASSATEPRDPNVLVTARQGPSASSSRPAGTNGHTQAGASQLPAEEPEIEVSAKSDTDSQDGVAPWTQQDGPAGDLSGWLPSLEAMEDGELRALQGAISSILARREAVRQAGGQTHSR